MDTNACAWCTSIATKQFDLPRPDHMPKHVKYWNSKPWVCDRHYLLLSIKYPNSPTGRINRKEPEPQFNLPLHRTEAGYPNCSTCDGGGCPDCTDPA